MDEKALMQEAVNRNIYLFDNTNVDVETPRPDKNIDYLIANMLSEIDDHVAQSDLFIMEASWYCAVATHKAVGSVLNHMKREDPDKIIPDTLGMSLAKGAVNVSYRMRELHRNGVYLKRVLTNEYMNQANKQVTYVISPVAVRFAFAQMKKPISLPSIVVSSWPFSPVRFYECLCVTRWIEACASESNIRHIARFRRFIADKAEALFHHFWFSSSKNDVEYSCVVEPFLMERDERFMNVSEYDIGIMRTLNNVNIFFSSSEGREKVPKAILIADREQCLGELAKLVKTHIKKEYQEHILLTTAGLCVLHAEHDDRPMYFGVNGKLYEDIPY